MPGKLELTVLLTRIMLPFLTFIALAAAFMGMLNALHHFFVPAVSPAMFNVGSIVCTVGLVAVMPQVGLPPIAAVAIGALVGAFAQWAVQWPLLHREGFRYRPATRLARSGPARVLLLMGPGTIGLAATQVNVFVNTLLATGEGDGRRVVAQRGVPPDVSADRPLRRVDRDGHHAGHLAAARAGRHGAAWRRRSPTASS